MIAVVDYGVGNIRSVLFALRRLNADAKLTGEPGEIAAASGVVLPGVGAFAPAMDSLRASGLAEPVRAAASAGTPLLGICLGHQLLFSKSEEHGVHAGLHLLEGSVRRFPPGPKVPHMGWNEVRQVRESPLFDGIADGAFFYFAHSYFTEPADAAVTIGVTDYGGDFACAVGRDNVFGTQFHPEKSGPVGLRMLANFCRLCGEQ